MKSNRDIFEAIGRACTIEVGLSVAGIALKKSAKRAAVLRPRQGVYVSPFRKDNNPSFTIYQGKSGEWRYSDKATGEGGNMINLVAQALRISLGEAAAIIDKKLNLGLWQTPRSSKKERTVREFENVDLQPLTDEVAKRISKSYGLSGTQGIKRLQRDGLLHVGRCWFRSSPKDYSIDDCWMLLDAKTKGGTARPIDGVWKSRNKSMCPKGWRKKPIGLSAVHASCVCLYVVEGEKDGLHAAHAIDSDDSCSVIIMPSTCTNLSPKMIPDNISTVVILAQADKGGVKAAIKWREWASSDSLRPEIWMPDTPSADWADLLQGLDSKDARDVLDNCKGYSRIEYGTDIDPNDYVEEEPAKRPAKQRGSAPAIDRDEQILNVLPHLPKGEKVRIADVCRALGLNPSKRSDTKKVERSMSRLRLR